MFDKRYIIIANDSNNRIWAYGSPKTNQPFKSEEAAERRKKEMEKLIGNSRDFLVIPLSDMPIGEVRRNG